MCRSDVRSKNGCSNLFEKRGNHFLSNRCLILSSPCANTLMHEIRQVDITDRKTVLPYRISLIISFRVKKEFLDKHSLMENVGKSSILCMKKFIQLSTLLAFSRIFRIFHRESFYQKTNPQSKNFEIFSNKKLFVKSSKSCSNLTKI